MKVALIAVLIVGGAIFVGGCGEKTAENQALNQGQLDAAKGKQAGANGIKASNGGGTVPVNDPPPPPGVKTGPPDVGGKSGGN